MISVILGVVLVGTIIWIIWFDKRNPPKELHVQSPWFEQIINRKKTVELRVGPLSKYRDLVNQVIFITNGTIRIPVQVISAYHYRTLSECIFMIGWKNCAPHAVDFDDAVILYRDIKKGETPYATRVFSDQRVQENGGITALTIIPV